MKTENEVFELCKQVYEATGLDDTENYYEERFVNGELYALDICKNVGYKDDGKEFSTGGDVVIRNHTPLYTSDYLLEKLPKGLERYSLTLDYMETIPETGEVRWDAGYAAHYHDGTWEVKCDGMASADTPLKALLKLTIALSEAGELK